MCLVGLRLVANKHSNIDFSMPSCLTNDVLGRHSGFLCVYVETHRAVDYSGQQVLVTTHAGHAADSSERDGADTGSVAGARAEGRQVYAQGSLTQEGAFFCS